MMLDGPGAAQVNAEWDAAWSGPATALSELATRGTSYSAAVRPAAEVPNRRSI